ncbi:transporter substrate-binding domain-containing protein [Brevibacillus migulae]|uniref:transporter substrate-binding domain-containing protein n=1 Tax=Brevibacillus migulae TaxID=1644114 RepID=UPI001F46FA37|nr:transporter substrate-binding domain-containing protein [Brevibacillus migulae]
MRVAFDRNLPPFSQQDEHNNMTGFSLDLLRAVAAQNGYELEYVPADWEEAIQLLRAGKVDVVAGMKYTSARDEWFDFTESYFTMSDVLIVPKTNATIQTVNHLKEKVVAVHRGGTALELTESVRRVKPLIAFSEPDALHYLMIGRADAFIGNRWTAELTLRKANRWDEFEMRSGMINPTDYAFAVKQGNVALLHDLNEGLAMIHRDGTYSSIYSHYFEPYTTHLTDFWKKIVIGLTALVGAVFFGFVFIFFWNKRLQAEVNRQTAALADMLSFQRTVLDNMESGIISVDTRHTITLVNRVARELLRLDKHARGHSLHEALPQLPFIHALPKAGERMAGEFLLEQGEERVLHYYVTAFLNRFGEPAGWIISLQDRTEQKQLQARLIIQEKMRALGQLVAGIAHELRNPLTAIKTFVELLPRKLGDDRFREEFLHYVPAEVERMNKILQDLLDYSRTQPRERSWVDVGKLIDSVIGLFARRLATEEIEVHLDAPAGVWIIGDGGQIKQVMINLVMNAIEAMTDRPRKQLRVEMRQDGEGIVLELSDTGEGMEETKMAQLFQPFYTTKVQGIGLGLYLSKKIMMEHGGDIHVRSKRGEGSTFSLRFERLPADVTHIEGGYDVVESTYYR